MLVTGAGNSSLDSAGLVDCFTSACLAHILSVPALSSLAPVRGAFSGDLSEALIVVVTVGAAVAFVVVTESMPSKRLVSVEADINLI